MMSLSDFSVKIVFVISLLNYSVCLWWIWGHLKEKHGHAVFIFHMLPISALQNLCSELMI